MTITEPTLTATAVLAAADALGDTIADRAADVEAARRIPPDLLDELIAAGCFRLTLPTSHGGVGADLPSALRMFESLASADGSVGWTVMIGSLAWCDLPGLPRSTFDAIFDGSDVIVAGAFAPSGSVTPTEGRYRVDGRWAFASGCEHATWLWGNCIEGFAGGAPQLRGAVVAPDQIVIEDTWHVSGLRGSGSHHFHADGVMVDAEFTFVPLAGEPCIDAPIVRAPLPSMIGLAVASTAIGVASGGLGQIVELAEGKLPLLSMSPLATNPLFQHELATATTGLKAARALVAETAERMWSAAVEGTPPSMNDRAEARAAAVWATQQAVAATDFAYRAGGGTSLYDESPLQRRLRDVHAIAQHFIVRPDTLTTAGAVYAGQEPAVAVF